MANPIYNIFNKPQQNNMQGMMQQFNAFRRAFRGDPKAEVQRLLNSGQMSQEQYAQYSNMARQLQQILK